MSGRVSTSLLPWQGNEVRYSWNSPTCAWAWIRPKCQRNGFGVPLLRKRNIWSRNLPAWSEKRRSGVFSFLAIQRWRLRYKDTQLCLAKTRRPDAFLAKMALQRIHRHTGEAQVQVHLQSTDIHNRLQSRRHLCQPCHPPQLATILEHNVPTWSISRLDILNDIHLIPVLNFPILMHLPRVARIIQILIQIRWLMKEHSLVSMLSVVW